MTFGVLLYIPSDYLSTICNKNEDFVTKTKIPGLKKSMSPDGRVMWCGGRWNMLKNEIE